MDFFDCSVTVPLFLGMRFGQRGLFVKDPL